MIDTIKGYMDLSEYPVPLQPFSDILDNPRRSTTQDNQTHFLKGYWNNFIIRFRYQVSDLGDEEITRIGFQGSIPKFIYGNNLASCSPEDIQAFIYSMSDHFNLDFHKAMITRIDFGFNFLVKKPTPYYINSIASFKRLKKNSFQDQSVTFMGVSNSQTILFYDKIREMMDKQKVAYASLPKFLLNCNILRFEVRLTKRTRVKLGLDSLTFSDLSSLSFFKILYEYLLTIMERVVIDDIEIPSCSFVVRRGWLKDFLAIMGLRSYGYDQTISLIENQDYQVSNPAVKKSQLKKSLRELLSYAEDLHSTSIKRELEVKLRALYGTFL